MKISLLTSDIFNLPGLFPPNTGLSDQMMIMDISKKTALTEEEEKEAEVTRKGPSISWKKSVSKEIDFSSAEFNFLKDQVTRLDKEKKFSTDNPILTLLAIKIKDAKEEVKEEDKKEVKK